MSWILSSICHMTKYYNNALISFYWCVDKFLYLSSRIVINEKKYQRRWQMDLFSVSLHPLDKKYYIFIHYYSNSKWIVPLYIPSKAIHFKTYSLWLKFSNFFVKSEKNIVGSSTRLRAETTLVAPLDKRFTWVCSSWTTNYVCCPWRTQLGVLWNSLQCGFWSIELVQIECIVPKCREDRMHIFF